MAITPPILIAFVVTLIMRRLRPETSFLLFSSSAIRLKPDQFRKTVAELDQAASIRADEFVMAAKTARLGFELIPKGHHCPGLLGTRLRTIKHERQ